jgi:stage II sporulation protein GA (sporulation sigma-E factor processing peptidase)
LVIYLDTLIVENFIVNYFLLYLTSHTVRIRVRIWRLASAALIGAVYVITKVYPSLFIFSNLIFKVGIALLMICLIFGKKNFLLNVKSLIIYMLYSMLLAGFCFFIEFNQQNFSGEYSSLYNFSYKKLMLAVILIYLVLDRLIIYIKDRKDLSSLIFTVEIVNNNVEKKIHAFLDTGNELREPATNLPVMIIEKSYFNDININKNDTFFIPYKVVNGSVDKLVGFKPDYIKIHYGEEVKRREVIVAFCDNKLSDLNDYQALLSRGII